MINLIKLVRNPYQLIKKINKNLNSFQFFLDFYEYIFVKVFNKTTNF